MFRTSWVHHQGDSCISSMVGFTCIPTRLLTPVHFKDHQNNQMDEKSDVHLYINHFFIALMFKIFRSYRSWGNNQYIDSSCHKLPRANSVQSVRRQIFRGVRKIAKSFFMLVRQSAHLFSLVEQIFPHWTHFYEIRYLSIFRKYF